MSDYPAENELALILAIPHTTAVRRNRWEFACAKPFLKRVCFICNKSSRFLCPDLKVSLALSHQMN